MTHRTRSPATIIGRAGAKTSRNWLDATSPTMREYGALAELLTSGNWNERAMVTPARASRMRAAATRRS